MTPNASPQLELTDAEKIWLARKRRGENQTQAGKRFQMSQPRYGELERAGGQGVLPVPIIIALSPSEVCVVLRKRLGWTRPQAARHRGVSEQTVYEWETGDKRGKVPWMWWLYGRYQALG